MSDVALNSAVRANLRSLQATTTLMSRTEERISTGKKVNSAIDNPSNFFTAAGLDRRSGDLTNLLDSIGSSVQTLKAADNGITSITDLVNQMKSTARTAQQSSSAVAEKASITSAAAIPGATSTGGLLGGSSLTGSVTTLKSASAPIGSSGVISLTYGAGPTTTTYKYSASESVSDLINKINADTATTKITASIDAATGKLKLANSDATNAGSVSDSGSVSGFNATAIATSGSALSANVVQTQFAASDTFTVNGVTITSGANLDTLLNNINAQTNSSGVKATIVNGAFSLTSVSGGSVNVQGMDSATQTVLDGSGTVFADNPLAGKTLTVQVGSLPAKTITFGTSDGQVDTLDELNAALKEAGAQASIDDTTGKLTVTTTNAHEADDIKVTGGTTTGTTASSSAGVLFDTDADTDGSTTTLTSSATFDDSKKKSRNDLKNDYNDLIAKIKDLAKDSSYNGVNLLAGDDLKVVFNEDGSSNLEIAGVDVMQTLGLTDLDGDEFLDSSSLDGVISKLNDALTNLDGLSSKFGNQLSVVQTRQDFTKAMVGTLDDGSNQLTAADTNEEAANLATLQTRQSLIVSSLSISTTSEQNILQLLR